jgi:hypothetical protein
MELLIADIFTDSLERFTDEKAVKRITFDFAAYRGSFHQLDRTSGKNSDPVSTFDTREGSAVMLLLNQNC